jgi:uncharacterized Fe-S cluster-containing radical SAM superfamily protein
MFNPIELSKQTERIVSNGDKRKYWATVNHRFLDAYYVRFLSVGCNLRCAYCMTPREPRDFPETIPDENMLTPEQVINKTVSILSTDRAFYKGKPFCSINILNATGCESTITKNHLIKLASLAETEESIDYFFIDTNGIVFGNDKDFVKKLAKFSKCGIRLGLKAATPEAFEQRTGARREFYDLPFQAIRHFLDYDLPFNLHVMSDSRLMPKEERETLTQKLRAIDPFLEKAIGDEPLIPFPEAMNRLEKAKIEIKWTEQELINVAYLNSLPRPEKAMTQWLR